MTPPSRAEVWLLPLGVVASLVLAWHLAVVLTQSPIFPTPVDVAAGIAELATKTETSPVRGDAPGAPGAAQAQGWEAPLLLKYVVASLFRVSAGFMLAILVGIPLGLAMGWFARVFLALNPLIQVLRPISPIAWIPVAILWFGVDDRGPVFLIFLSSVFPITTATAAAVRTIPPVYVRAARNFGVTGLPLFRRVILPAALPQIVTGLRLALGVAWLVVVAAEMFGITSGLGYLIIDARNAGKRYDLVVAGMVLIGLIGLVLDVLVRRLERLDEVRWGLSPQ